MKVHTVMKYHVAQKLTAQIIIQMSDSGQRHFLAVAAVISAFAEFAYNSVVTIEFDIFLQDIRIKNRQTLHRRTPWTAAAPKAWLPLRQPAA